MFLRGRSSSRTAGKRAFTPLEINRADVFEGKTSEAVTSRTFKRKRSSSLRGPVRKTISNGAGFTILELLIALLIFSFVLTVVTSTIWMGMRIIKRSRAIAQKYTGARIALDFISGEIRSAFDFRFPGYKNFTWDPDKKVLSFWKIANDGMALTIKGDSPVYRATYYQVNEEGTDIIYRKIKSVYPMEVVMDEGPMVEGSFDLEIEPAPTKDPEDLPQKVTIHFKINGKDELQRTVELSQYERF